MSEHKVNPANGKVDFPKGYRPMSSATLRLQVPDKDGWHRHWFRGTPERIARAQQAGYRFVDKEDIEDEGGVNSFDLASDSDTDSGTDLGSRVSIISGDDVDSKGQPGRMYLMECPQEFYEHSMAIVNSSTDDVATALRGGTVGQEGATRADKSNTYVGFQQPGSKLRSKVPDLLVKK